MMAGARPATLVSSTFFDLKQVREDIRRFLENDLLHTVLMSELPTFPVDPSLELIENCRRRVEREADILVLIIGARHGSVSETHAKSVTNIEYLAARAKRIPIYAFVDRSVLAMLPLWETNPSATFDGIVDNPALFEFVKQVRSVDGVWMHEFSRAADITDVLRAQFAYMFTELLGVWHQLRQRSDERSLAGLRGQSLRLALERPDGWELLLFAQIVIDGVAEAADLRREHEEALAIELGEDISDPTAWLQFRLNDLRRLIDSFNSLVESSVRRALAPDTHTLDELVFAAQTVIRIYVTLIRWSRRVRTANLNERFQTLVPTLARFADDAIVEISDMGARLKAAILVALTLPDGDPGKTIEFTIKITLSHADAFQEKLRGLRLD